MSETEKKIMDLNSKTAEMIARDIMHYPTEE